MILFVAGLIGQFRRFVSDTSPNTATYSGPPLGRGLVAFRTRLTLPSRMR